ncbi:hypothetical protein NM688_g2087 [Phlebia brevispora]|uniref:Uncharacterized protein n=1 Tax=Phlebia brevispora TaxID=194682 RepID=A0ACC1T9E1_9APHY|nr:hypothetical protein NM688_g2087 [Phlebia brevispora]
MPNPQEQRSKSEPIHHGYPLSSTALNQASAAAGRPGRLVTPVEDAALLHTSLHLPMDSKPQLAGRLPLHNSAIDASGENQGTRNHPPSETIGTKLEPSEHLTAQSSVFSPSGATEDTAMPMKVEQPADLVPSIMVPRKTEKRCRGGWTIQEQRRGEQAKEPQAGDATVALQATAAAGTSGDLAMPVEAAALHTPPEPMTYVKLEAAVQPPSLIGADNVSGDREDDEFFIRFKRQRLEVEPSEHPSMPSNFSDASGDAEDTKAPPNSGLESTDPIPIKRAKRGTRGGRKWRRRKAARKAAAAAIANGNAANSETDFDYTLFTSLPFEGPVVSNWRMFRQDIRTAFQSL